MKEFRELKNLTKGDNTPDDDYIVVEVLNHNYTLIYRNSSYEPWVVAFGYDREAGYWMNGHYFSTIVEAMRWFDGRGKRNED